MARALLIASGVWLVLLPVLGCNRVEVMKYPDFYTPEIKRIAVLPLRCFPGVHDQTIGSSVASKIESALVQNRTYDVYARQYLHELFSEDDLTDAGVIKAEAAQRIRQRASVHAVVCGSVTRCEMRSEERRRIRQDGSVKVKWKNSAVLNVAVVLIDTATGHQLGAVSAHGEDDSDGTTPRYTPRDLLHRIEVEVTQEIIEQLAAKKVKATVSSESVRVAQNKFGLNWDFTRSVLPNRPFFVVISLPPEFDKNHCTLILASEAQRRNLETRETSWNKANQYQDFEFDAGRFTEEAGEGKFNALLYHGQNLVARRAFEVRTPRDKPH